MNEATNKLIERLKALKTTSAIPDAGGLCLPWTMYRDSSPSRCLPRYYNDPLTTYLTGCRFGATPGPGYIANTKTRTMLVDMGEWRDVDTQSIDHPGSPPRWALDHVALLVEHALIGTGLEMAPSGRVFINRIAANRVFITVQVFPNR